MDKFIKNLKDNNFMKRFILFFIILLGLISSVNSALLYDGINDDLSSYDDDLNLYEVSNYLWLVFTNLTLDLSTANNYNYNTLLNYLVFNNNNISVPFVFQAVYELDNGSYSAVFREVELPAGSSTMFVVEPTTNNENIDIYVRCESEKLNESQLNTTTCGSGLQIRETILRNVDEVPSSNTIFSPLINGVIDLININISIWKIVYYLFIATIILSIIGFIVLLGFKYYQWADSHDIYKRKNSRK